MYRRGLAPLEQPSVLEEHVDELPEHVVERLDQLLVDELVVPGWDERPRGPGVGREGDGQAAAGPGDHESLMGLVVLGLEGDRDVSGLGHGVDL